MLYLDDEPDNLVVFKSAFRRYYNIHTATNASEALDIVKNNDIALILTDQRMPQVTGIEFLNMLPDEPENIRIILTGYSDVSVVIDAINTGKVYRYITKPWEKDDLKITIDKALEAYELRRQNKVLVRELTEAGYQVLPDRNVT